jgi:hypothetical protein
MLDISIAQILSRGKGHLHGIDSSRRMIEAAQNLARRSGIVGVEKKEIITFEGQYCCCST